MTLLDSSFSLTTGGRFNLSEKQATNLGLAPNPALYLALETETAFAEAVGPGLPEKLKRARAFYAARYKVSKLLDLRQRDATDALAVSSERLRGDWKVSRSRGEAAYPQQLGHALWEAGVEAVLYWSLRHPGGSNLVLFPDNFVDGSSVEVLDESGELKARKPL